MDENYFKRITSLVILLILLILSFFLLKPILMSIIFGVILAFLFSPVYDWMNKKIKSKNITAVLISLVLIVAIILPIWFLTPIIIDQSLKIYTATSKLDFVSPLKVIFPKIFASEQFSSQVGSTIYSFVTKSINSTLNYLATFILNFPIFFLQLVVAFFTFFFVLKDKDQFISYIKSLLPFSKEVEKKLFEQSKGITISVLYGQIIVGIIQGLITGAGFFIFKVQNALLLSLLAIIAGVFPVIGTTIIWLPVMIYLFVAGNPFAGIGIAFFGLISSLIDNVLKPMFVSQRTSLPTSVIMIGMIGGVLMFGILGFILGPLILAYLLIILEVYRNKKIPGILVQEKTEKPRLNLLR